MGYRITIAAAVAAAVCIFVSCMPPLGLHGNLGLGELTIRVADDLARTLEPPVGTAIECYDVFGAGPNGAFVYKSFTGSAVTLENLVSGDWSIEVDGRNAAGTVVTHGAADVGIEAGDESVIDIVTAAVAGTGALELSVSWDPASVDAPSIRSRLSAPQGTPLDLAFTLGAPGSAVYSNGALEQGYYTLVIELLDNGVLVMGAVDVVRIVREQTTAGTIDFTDVNTGTGSIVVGITPHMSDPIPVTMSGQQAELGPGQPMTVTASVPAELGAATCVWYLNGVSVGTGAAITLNDAVSVLGPGPYRLDVTAFVLEGSRGGSASCAFTVVEGTEEVTLDWNPNSEADLAGYRIYVGTSSGIYDRSIDVGLVTSYTVTYLRGAETYWFAATAYDSSGVESNVSNEVSYVTP